MKRKPLTSQAGLASAVDYLLREFKALPRTPDLAAAAVDAYQFTGPIDYTYLVASVDARSEIRELADFKCSGTNDEQEIGAALALLTTPGVVVLTEGTFTFDTANDVTLTIPDGCVLRGAGKYSTIIKFTETNTLDIELNAGSVIESLKILGV